MSAPFKISPRVEASMWKLEIVLSSSYLEFFSKHYIVVAFYSRYSQKVFAAVILIFIDVGSGKIFTCNVIVQKRSKSVRHPSCV